MTRLNLIAPERGKSQAVQLLDTERMLADLGEPDAIEEAVGDREELLDQLAHDILEYSSIAFVLFQAWRARNEAQRAGGGR